MQVFENAVPIRSRQLVQGVDRRVRVACAGKRPGRQQRRGQIGDRTAHRLRKVVASRRVMLFLQLPNADDKPRNPIAVIDRQQPVGELAGAVDIAVAQLGEKSAAQQIGIVRIELQHVQVIGRRRALVALRRSVPGGEITAGGVVGRQLLLCRRLGGERGGQTESEGDTEKGGMPGQQINHEISIGELFRLAELDRQSGNRSARPSKQRENDPFAATPQGHKVRPRPRAFPRRTWAFRPQRRRNRGIAAA